MAKLLHLQGGGKLLRYNNFTAIQPYTLKYGDYNIASYGSYNDFDGGQWCDNLKKIFNQNSVYYGLRNNNSGNKIVNVNEAFMLSSCKFITDNVITGTDFAASIANYIRDTYTRGNTMPNFTYDDAIYSLEQNTSSSGSQSSIVFYVSYCGMENAHNGSTLEDILIYGENDVIYDDWMIDIFPYISDAIDWEYSMSSPAVSSTWAEKYAFRYVDSYANKTYIQYRNVSMRLSIPNRSLPEIESILILAPLYVRGIRLRTNCGVAGEGRTHEFNPIFSFTFCNVFLISYEDMVDGGLTQDIEISGFKIYIPVRRRNGGSISGTNRQILINNYWL